MNSNRRKISATRSQAQDECKLENPGTKQEPCPESLESSNTRMPHEEKLINSASSRQSQKSNRLHEGHGNGEQGSDANSNEMREQKVQAMLQRLVGLGGNDTRDKLPKWLQDLQVAGQGKPGKQSPAAQIRQLNMILPLRRYSWEVEAKEELELASQEEHIRGIEKPPRHWSTEVNIGTDEPSEEELRRVKENEKQISHVANQLLDNAIKQHEKQIWSEMTEDVTSRHVNVTEEDVIGLRNYVDIEKLRRVRKNVPPIIDEAKMLVLGHDEERRYSSHSKQSREPSSERRSLEVTKMEEITAWIMNSYDGGPSSYTHKSSATYKNQRVGTSPSNMTRQSSMGTRNDSVEARPSTLMHRTPDRHQQGTERVSRMSNIYLRSPFSNFPVIPESRTRAQATVTQKHVPSDERMGFTEEYWREHEEDAHAARCLDSDSE
jgi:hypothetical protein